MSPLKGARQPFALSFSIDNVSAALVFRGSYKIEITVRFNFFGGNGLLSKYSHLEGHDNISMSMSLK
jgi:hypothetical protein